MNIKYNRVWPLEAIILACRVIFGIFGLFSVELHIKFCEIRKITFMKMTCSFFFKEDEQFKENMNE